MQEKLEKSFSQTEPKSKITKIKTIRSIKSKKDMSKCLASTNWT